MLHQVKENMFTPHGIITSLVHLFFTVGLVICVAAFKIFVMGEDPAGLFHPPQQQEEKEDKPATKGKGN